MTAISTTLFLQPLSTCSRRNEPTNLCRVWLEGLQDVADIPSQTHHCRSCEVDAVNSSQSNCGSVFQQVAAYRTQLVNVTEESMHPAALQQSQPAFKFNVLVHWQNTHTDNHVSTPPLSFLQARCPSCRPTNSVKALKALYTDNGVKKFAMQSFTKYDLS